MVRVSEVDESFIRPDPEASREEFMTPWSENVGLSLHWPLPSIVDIETLTVCF